MTACLCSHSRHDIPGGTWEPCTRSCGCVRYRPDPRVRRDPFAALELYPDWMAACPHCDSPYGTVHGPDCPFDPERLKIAARREAAERSCICPRFSDTGGFRIADLCCPVHGIGGTEPGDGYWEAGG